MIRISAFTDCDSESAVIRVPYSLLADMINHCPKSKDLIELLNWLKKSSKLKKLVNIDEIESEFKLSN